MKNRICLILVICAAAILAQGLVAPSAQAFPGASKAMRETAEFVLSKFGWGTAGKSVAEITETTAKMVTRHGDDVLPFLRRTGHSGFEALDQAGNKAQDVLKLVARKGDHAVPIVSDARSLNIFLRYGDNAADAMIKHPGIAENLITRYGDNAARALNAISKQNAQRFGMLADEGVFTASSRSPELIAVIGRHG
ncbi:MAG: hypothetical protein QMD09_14715, partial [Desulfatibacillaceae bacterium]|nr:hypothetical protein [Desulfatibacillaceae bacterium]